MHLPLSAYLVFHSWWEIIVVLIIVGAIAIGVRIYRSNQEKKGTDNSTNPYDRE